MRKESDAKQEALHMPPKTVSAYLPRLLKTMREICIEFKTTEACVRKWVRQGAPVATRGCGKSARYSCEIMQLHNWILEQKEKNGDF